MSLHLKLLDIDHPLTFEESKLRQIEAHALIYLRKWGTNWIRSYRVPYVEQAVVRPLEYRRKALQGVKVESLSPLICVRPAPISISTYICIPLRTFRITLICNNSPYNQLTVTKDVTVTLINYRFCLIKIKQSHWITRSVCFECYCGASCFDLVFSCGYLTDSVLGHDLASVVYKRGKQTHCPRNRHCSRVTFVHKHEPCIVITTTDFFSAVLAINFASALTFNFVEYLVTSYIRRHPVYRSWSLVNKKCNNISRVWWDG